MRNKKSWWQLRWGNNIIQILQVEKLRHRYWIFQCLELVLLWEEGIESKGHRVFKGFRHDLVLLCSTALMNQDNPGHPWAIFSCLNSFIPRHSSVPQKHGWYIYMWYTYCTTLCTLNLGADHAGQFFYNCKCSWHLLMGSLYLKLPQM